MVSVNFMAGINIVLISILLSSSFHYASLLHESDHEIKVNTNACRKPHFVMVHGHGSAAWAWYKVQALMEASGYIVSSLDLKGAGLDLTNPSEVHTFEAYNEPLVDFFTRLPDNEKVILVGGSAGGLSVTDVSYKFREKIGVAVYVAATMLKHGYISQQDIEDGAPLYARGGKSNITCRRTTSQEVKVLGKLLSRPPVPVKVLLRARFEVDNNKTEDVKRVYIKTRFDQTLLPHQQDAMIKKWPPSEVMVVDTDHDIVTADPFLLFGLLVKVVISTFCI